MVNLDVCNALKVNFYVNNNRKLLICFYNLLSKWLWHTESYRRRRTAPNDEIANLRTESSPEISAQHSSFQCYPHGQSCHDDRDSRGPSCFCGEL